MNSNTLDDLSRSFSDAEDVEWDDDTQVRLHVSKEVAEILRKQAENQQAIAEASARTERVTQQMTTAQDEEGNKPWYRRRRVKKKNRDG